MVQLAGAKQPAHKPKAQFGKGLVDFEELPSVDMCQSVAENWREKRKIKEWTGWDKP